MKSLLPHTPHFLSSLPTKSLSVNLQPNPDHQFPSPIHPIHPLPSLNPSLSVVSGGLVPLVGLVFLDCIEDLRGLE